MSRILFVANTTLGHIARLLSVASELDKTGPYQITFAMPKSPRYKTLIHAAGYSVRTLPVKTIPVRTAKGDQLRLDLDTFSGALEDLVNEMDPAAIVVDFNQLNLCAAMRWPQAPRILITNVFLTDLSPHTTVQGHMFPKLANVINANRAAKGLPAIDSVTELYEADLVCLADPDILVSQFAPLRANHRTCGACYWESDAPLPDDLPDFDAAVLFSMGSTGTTRISAELVAAMKEISGADFAIYAGAGADEMSGTASGAGLVDYAATMLPLQQIFPKVKLAVTQGGAGSTYQALSHGVPVVTLPTHTNHEILGQALAQKKLVYCLPKSGIIPPGHPVDYAALAQNAHHFATDTNRKNGPAEIARHIREYLSMHKSRPNPHHPKPAAAPPAHLKARPFRYADASHGALAQNKPHNFALSQATMIFGANACCTWIPKNACSTLRFSIARANGCISDLKDINWIHSNNKAFPASTETAFRATYTFTLLRCPYARLYSAFMDKIVNFDIQAWQFYTSGDRKLHPHDLTFKGFVKELGQRPLASFDIHWRRQTDFLLFRDYDDIFSLEDFSGFIATVKNRIGLDIIDTRPAIGHETSSQPVYSALKDPFDIPALELLNNQKSGIRPDPKSMFDPEIAAIFRKLYNRDLTFYSRRIGTSALMEHFA